MTRLGGMAFPHGPCGRACFALAALLFGTGTSAANPQDARIPPDLSTYAAIDAALEHEILVPPGATWSVFPGVEEPSPDIEWTTREFNDADWMTAPAPFGFGHEGLGTRFDDLDPPITTLYLRRMLKVPDPAKYAAIDLVLPMDDGFIAYVNGESEGRLNAGYTKRNAFDAMATYERGIDVVPVPLLDLTRILEPGANQIAIQVLAHKDDLISLGVRPFVRAELRDDPDHAGARFETLAALLEGEGTEARAAYLEGRYLQRLGRFEEAAPRLLAAAELDPAAPEPWTRLAACRRAEGRLSELEEILRERNATGAYTPASLDAWARVFLGDSVGFVDELAAFAPTEAELPERGFFADALWAGNELLEGRPLRIDCGSETDHDTNGVVWSRDRFATRGVLETREGGEVPRAAVRICEKRPLERSPVYRIPLPDGRYALRLHFTADVEAPVDVLINGSRAFLAHDPYADEVALESVVMIAGGFLELDVLPLTHTAPRIAGFEIERVETERFQERARTWTEETGWHESFPIVQLAHARALAGDLPEALDLFEQASLLPGFGDGDQSRLSALRDELMPELLSYSTADDLVVRRRGEARALLAEVQEHVRPQGPRSRAESRDDNETAWARYFEGRIHQEAGRLDDAIIAFEEIAFSGRTEPEPVLRMAECLVASELLLEAEGIVSEALFGGVRATPELLRLWLSLNLGELARDEWDVVSDLRKLDVPDMLTVVPTAEDIAQPWEFLDREPPSTTWSRRTFDTSPWQRGPGGVGTGLSPGASIRSLWNTRVVFARRAFQLPGRKLLYPYARTSVDDAGDVYLNGVQIVRLHKRTDGYVYEPMRGTSFEKGLNYVGMYAINWRGPGYIDVGIYEPLGELMWIQARLERRGAIRINCGGPLYESDDGTVWSSDRFSAYARSFEADDKTQIKGTDDDALYRTHSWFGSSELYSSWYKIPLPNGPYAVTLHFAELRADDVVEEKPSQFDVKLEAKVVLEAYDIAATAGIRTSATHTFDITIQDGWLDLEIVHKTGFPILNALEVVQAK